MFTRRSPRLACARSRGPSMTCNVVGVSGVHTTTTSLSRSTVRRFSKGDSYARGDSGRSDESPGGRERARSRPRAPSVAAQAMDGSAARQLVSVTL